ncbi:hypothetical protein CcCBS67573_g04731 [Chytriomyces confervae]|uniref:protein-tyrosine-phosphatase n=1 Tax=Chytriomyces confervae TaxID=246404 RepID=A0A507FE08_9FUNG|nr:hypothetical protein CcCBS67573_g04731 [Chytriomyces confervae]
MTMDFVSSEIEAGPKLPPALIELSISKTWTLSGSSDQTMMNSTVPGPSRCVPLARAMSTVEKGNMRFVIFDAPSESNLINYLEELKLRNVTCIVRVCEPTYDKSIAEKNGIKVYDFAFADGTCPPQEVILSFLQICDERFSAPGSTQAIGVHCIAGLGRAPVLVAIALIESGMIPIEVIEFVRKHRRGAFNSVQLAYLADTYKVMKRKGHSVETGLKKKNSGIFESFARVFKK